jgi:hypothetical protein
VIRGYTEECGLVVCAMVLAARGLRGEEEPGCATGDDVMHHGRHCCGAPERGGCAALSIDLRVQSVVNLLAPPALACALLQEHPILRL